MPDAKITALPASTGLAAVDLFPVVDDPSGAPATQKLTAEQLRDFVTPRGHIWGLTLANNSTDATNDIDVAPGEAKDEGNAALMVLSATMTKRIDASWAAGTGQGGLNTGTVANATWYEVHLIRDPTTGAVDVMFTTTADRATLPSGYTQQRRIGWVRRGTALNLAFTQVDDRFILATSVNDVSATVTTTATQVALTAPPASIALFRASITNNASTNAATALLFYEDAESSPAPAPSDSTGVISLGIIDVVGASGGHFELRVNSSSQIWHDCEAVTGNPTFDVNTYGWKDTRGRLS